ncbi:D-alanyl-D-alanine carboxypeptidase [Pseudomonas sp. NIBR-H-19]|nr:D-alanyl-D-alanine carboxypeptidase family protein [Pseudomonas sp. NIBR-H-19]UHC81464.1 D-alanyl-D-alanine carboxypeptidase [Pseudomonas sp. NIBR-H-19]
MFFSDTSLGGSNIPPSPASPTARAMIPAPPQLSAKSWVLMDAATGSIIGSQNADMHLPPASLTKLMTVYVATNEIQAGRLKIDDPVTVSENAWKTGGSRMFLDPGSVVPVHDLLRGVVIDSGNDASVALSEHIAGSEDAFAGLMNVTANKLGLTDTHFMNPTGLPAPGHYSSAHDMARLARAIINDESAYYPLYAHKYFTWNNIRQPNRNLLLWRDPSVDGLKTGHTEEAGYCMVTSALRDGRRLISAVFGSTTLNNRAEDTQKILNYGFRFFETKTYQKGGQVLAQPRLWKGEKNVISVGLLDDVTLTLPKNSNRKVESRLHINNALEAPIAVGDIVGSYELYDGENKLVTRSLIALEAGEAGGWWTRIWDAFHLFFAGLFDVQDDTGEVKA